MLLNALIGLAMDLDLPGRPSEQNAEQRRQDMGEVIHRRTMYSHLRNYEAHAHWMS